MERNEVVCWSPLIATYFGRDPYKRWHKSGFVRAVVQSGAKRDERLKDVPTLDELMQQYKTPDSGKRLAKVILTAATLGRPIAAPAALDSRANQNFPRCLCKDPERSGTPRGNRQARLGCRSNKRRRTRIPRERCHCSTEGSDRTHEVGARELIPLQNCDHARRPVCQKREMYCESRVGHPPPPPVQKFNGSNVQGSRTFDFLCR